ncbi:MULTISPECIES: cytochrome ubiquinol oxidase subunit I [Gulosibacter]|uniref:Cytochrome ubiquinol oxidase subunit I n=1 Tax=Gulosibacter sediminis TaxID=1729695 RepID=A0ABY4MUP8_9MICO|nr:MULTISPECIES: cytochrome ubiquinol oxidase subunit I [Gulosibacter]UQN14109.1 cytochrome ubiquinol oxidase subunit I [Gulosibacter sediminis]
MEALLDPLILSRWQFGLTTLYHFLFVPITLGVVLCVAIWQTAWLRTGKVQYLQLTKFFGNIFLINFAMGIVTGIVQEFQFGMNWSNYSRFVGDIFGAPLAFEGLVAFFMEATFIGLWIFGWDKLKPGLHLLTIWMTVLGTWISAYFILAANAFMQNPVGFEFNPDTGRAELVDFMAVLTNPVALTQLPHTLAASVMLAGTIIVGVAAWHLRKGQHFDVFRPAMRFGLWTVLISGFAVMLSGHELGLAMTATQPMKMAAAEAMWNTSSGADASFSLFSIGTPDGTEEVWSLRVPYVSAFLATNSFSGTVEGINDLQAQYQELYGADQIYYPVIWVTYWSFRWMMFFGMASMAIALVGLWVTRKNYATKNWHYQIAIWTATFPLWGILIGWVFTEMGRQPWLVFGLMPTEAGVSPNVSGLSVLISLIAFTLIYGILAIVEVKLILRAAQSDPIQVPGVNDEGIVENVEDVKVKASVY